MEEVLLSAGIDIGTSTTQLVFSKLRIRNMASDFSVPRIEIVDKEIFYKSRIYMTPLLNGQVIDGDGIREILKKEYAQAGVSKSQVKTGAVIITGETAGKRNAKDIVLKCSEFAGDFVVATAGPDLESIISGKGAGADVFSKREHTSVVHLDIGGGTSNLSVFVNGTSMDCGCLDIGGRILKVDSSQCVTYISPKLQRLIERHCLEIHENMTVTAEILKPVLKILTDILKMSVGLEEKTEDYDLMVTNHGLEKDIDAAYISFSGGVAEYIYDGKEETDDFAYGDIGILLGKEIRNSSLFNAKKVYESEEKIRATVVGAGSHTTKISGSTVWADAGILPLKNIPIIKVEPQEEFTKEHQMNLQEIRKQHTPVTQFAKEHQINLQLNQPPSCDTWRRFAKEYQINIQGIETAIIKKSHWYTSDELGDLKRPTAAVALAGLKSPSFIQVQQYATAICRGFQSVRQSDQPMIIIVGEDMGKVLGQCLRAQAGRDCPIICLDGIELEQGDYIDIGIPAAGGLIVPVVVKTLVFKSEEASTSIEK